MVDYVLCDFVIGGVGGVVVVVEQFYQSGKRYVVGCDNLGVGVVLLGVVDYFVYVGGVYYVSGGFVYLLDYGDSIIDVVELF